MSQTKAGFALSMIFIGFICGGPLIGHYSDLARNRRSFIRICTLLGTIALLPLLYLTQISNFLVFAILFFIGLCASAQLLTYSYAVDILPSHVKGTAIALTNFFGLFSAIVFQPFIGWILDVVWDGTKINGVPFYSLENYQVALICFPMTYFCAFLLTFFLKPIPKK
jgi:MFS family permease